MGHVKIKQMDTPLGGPAGFGYLNSKPQIDTTVKIRVSWLHAGQSCSNHVKNQMVSKKFIAPLLRRYWFSSDDVKMKIA